MDLIPAVLPTATFVLYAYNEAQYIRDAIVSAFAQTYSPLEIVLSDDGSTDRTYAIIEEMAATYQGPHRIILNHNERNIGIGSQLNAAVAKTTGELIVLANGDDISLPHRVTTLMERWLATEKKASVLTSNLAVIGVDGEQLGRVMKTETLFETLEQGIRKRFGGVAAASLAVRRDVFEAFGPLPENLLLEDNPMYMRAALLGDRVHLAEPLVHYRVHQGNISQAYAPEEFEVWRHRHHQKAIWQTSEAVKVYLQMLRDLHSMPAEHWPARDLKRARWAGMEKLMEQAILRDYYSKDYNVRALDRIASLLRLLLLQMKLLLKQLLPSIERRNDRWHYQRVLNQ